MSRKNILSFLMLMPFFSFASTFIETTDVGNEKWPYEMNSSKSFDVASKCEMLVFMEVFNTYNAFSEAILPQKIGVKSMKTASVNTWKKVTKERIIANFNKLSSEALNDVVAVKSNSSWETLSSINLKEKLPENCKSWYESTVVFYTSYVKEQLRLAALYPRITSEILQFSENEIQGHNLSDKNFLLTFDDGPTVINGNTDKLIKVLERYNLTAMFFVLGDNLEKRLKSSSIGAIQNLYGANSVFSHGKVHKSHQKYTLWKESIEHTNTLLHKVFPTENKSDLMYFRPPYGQRNKMLVDYFTERESKIIFWNIDSRDWSSKLNAQQVAERQIRLMLLWRNGILLFHDIHSKSQKAVPIIYNYFKDTNITWMKSDAI